MTPIYKPRGFSKLLTTLITLLLLCVQTYYFREWVLKTNISETTCLAIDLNLSHFMTSLGRSTWLVRLFFSLLPFCDFTTTATGTTRRQARRCPGSLAFVGLVGERVWICGWTVGAYVSTQYVHQVHQGDEAHPWFNLVSHVVHFPCLPKILKYH